MFDFDPCLDWMKQRVADLQKSDVECELRFLIAGIPMSKLEVRLKTLIAAASFTAWGNGMCDWSIMDARSATWVKHCWALKLENETFAGAFETFLSHALSVT